MRGIDRIAAERHRQINTEGFTAAKDIGKEHELAEAGWCYLQVARLLMSWAPENVDMVTVPDRWPWPPKYYKVVPSAQRMLVKAGALYEAARHAWTSAGSAKGSEHFTAQRDVCAALLDGLDG